MNLNKRAGLLILPVILVSYILAAFFIYEQQAKSIHQLEQNKLDLRLNNLRSEFLAYNRFVDAYQTFLIEGDTLAQFIRDTDNIFRDRMLSSNLKSAISRYFSNKSQHASLSIITSDNQKIFYVENSTDPFADISTVQLNMAAVMQEKKVFQSWRHYPHLAPAIIQKGVTVDSRTLSSPHVNQLNHTLHIIVTVAPKRFERLLKKTTSEFKATIEYLTTKPLPEQNILTSSVALRDQYYLKVTPSRSYLDEQLSVLKTQLLSLVVIGVFVSYTILQYLIRKYITSPISLLDEQLTDVMEKKRGNIEAPRAADEVGRLGRKFHRLYEQLNQSFLESRHQSRTDALTQLPNRAAFYESAAVELAEAEQFRSELSIAYLDLDNFKFVNDKYGHEVGDKLLKTVAVRLQSITRQNEDEAKSKQPSVYRLSGDEFIIMLPDLNRDQTYSLCEKVLNLFTDGYHFDLGNFPVTASIGVATFPNDGHSLSQLISNADLAMYQAKKSGKNKQASYSKELAKKDRELKEVENKLKTLNCDQEFKLFYMPIIDSHGHIKGCEALLRWTSEELGSVSPALFIPIAESTGIFEKIDLWVIQQAFQDSHLLKNSLDDHFELSINISSAEIGSERFSEKVTNLCHKYNVQPNSFVIEITETFALQQEQDALKWLSSFRNQGFKIAIDDFGTGYTSLMQMLDYPVDIIKFDKQLIERIGIPDKRDMTKALIGLCHLQQIDVVAEGIETDEQYKILLGADCDYLQGFYMAKPMPIDEFLIWAEDFQQESSEQT
ncbi:bifunctional diguanylate cyclase/phosphodiesterase [Neptuniibacter sp.]|uniref:bifunctional diguanylate cyclase/phosphodiesterase n=1 Tax=Neptuniibacter sp. TaxID=1962643 RepID=UPI00261E7620|nr:bifunctional diguanylate cyclase/phosphodiesterase [Neptuniibacter sp.]MCP4598811.1 bifunctional diguanylate cyclase/phosphodiesterase [Neptuniibacter sp.]